MSFYFHNCECGYILFEDDYFCLNCGKRNPYCSSVFIKSKKVKLRMKYSKFILHNSKSLIELENQLKNKKEDLTSKLNLLSNYSKLSSSFQKESDSLLSSSEMIKRIINSVDLDLIKIDILRWKNLIEPISFAQNNKLLLKPDYCINQLRLFTNLKDNIITKLDNLDSNLIQLIRLLKKDINQVLLITSNIIEKNLLDDVYGSIKNESLLKNSNISDNSIYISNDITIELNDIIQKLESEIDRLNAEEELL